MIAQRIRRAMLALLAAELASLCLAFAFCYFSFYDYLSVSSPKLPYQPQGLMFFFISGFTISIFAAFTHFSLELNNMVNYATSSIIHYSRTSFISLLLIWGVGMLAGFFMFSGGAAYLFFVFMLAVCIINLPLSFGIIRLVRRIYNAPINRINVLIIGVNRRSLLFAEKLRANSQLGFNVAGFVDPEASDAMLAKDYLGRPEAVEEIIKDKNINMMLFFLPVRSFYDTCNHIAALALKYGIAAISTGDIFNRPAQQPAFGIQDLGQMLFGAQSQQQLGIFMRRSLDVLLSVLLMVITFPLGLAISGHIYARGGYPVLLTRQAVGQNRQAIRLYKFRVHKLDKNSAENRPTEIPPQNSGEELIMLGGLMRALRLDSLPYLVNIASGSMSFIGPRPLSPEDFERLTPEEQTSRAAKKPGLFGR